MRILYVRYHELSHNIIYRKDSLFVQMNVDLDYLLVGNIINLAVCGCSICMRLNLVFDIFFFKFYLTGWASVFFL